MAETKNKNVFEEVRESDDKYKFGTMEVGGGDWYNIWMKSLSVFQAMYTFWEPRISIGTKCMSYYKRNIFSQTQLDYYEVLGKIPIQPQEVKQVVNALTTQIKDNVQGSYVDVEDETAPPNAASVEDVNIVLSFLKQQAKVKRRQEEVLRLGLITGYPQWIWFDLVEENGEKVLKSSHPEWDSSYCSRFFTEPDGSDVDEANFVFVKTKAQLLEIYPDREDDYNEHSKLINSEDPGLFSQLYTLDGDDNTSDNRKEFLRDIIASTTFDAPQGMYTAMQRVFPIKTKQKVWYSEEEDRAIFFPPNWDQEQKDYWLRINPSFNVSKTEERRTLWVTTVDNTGFVWENDLHWYQNNGDLPGRVYVADNVSKDPTGIVEDMLPVVFSIAVQETEGLHQVRNGSGQTTVIEEGALKEPVNSVRNEFNKDNGIVIVSKTARSGAKSIQTHKRTPNTVFLDMAERSRGQLRNVHKVNETILGATNPRQSDVAKQTEIAQGMAPQFPYVQNFSNFDLDVSQLIVNMMPFVLEEDQIIRIRDEFGANPQQVTVNQTGVDESSGEPVAKIISTDLTLGGYRIIPVAGEDTPLSRRQATKELLDLVRAIGNQLLQSHPLFVARLIKTFPNRYAQDLAKDLEEFAQQQQAAAQAQAQAEKQSEEKTEVGRRLVDLEKINTPKVSVKVNPEDVAEHPQISQMLLKIGEQ